jgi:ionotropic glutamate receptor
MEQQLLRLSLLFLAVAGVPQNGRAQQPQIPNNIRIAGMFDGEQDMPVEAAFRHAVNMVNDDRSTLIRSTLNGVINQVSPSDSFKASKAMCEMMNSGMVAVFGPQSSMPSNHIQSMTDAFHIPHIETRWDYSYTYRPYAINMRPHPAMIGQAYASFVKEFNWKSLVVIYENEESLVRLQEILKFPKKFDGFKMVLYQLNPLSDDYRPMFKTIFKSGEKKIVLDCSFEKIERVMLQAKEIGLITEYYSYFITSLDVERLDLSPFKGYGPDRFKSPNITSYRLVDPSQPQVAHYLKKWTYMGRNGKGRDHPLFTDNVLMYDAVRVFAKSLDDLGRIDGFQASQINCQNLAQVWRGGFKVINYVRKVEFQGLTGEIVFDNDGFRTDFHLDLLEKHRDSMVKTGIWEPNVGLNFTITQVEVDTQKVEKLANKTLRVVTATNDPFVMKRELSDEQKELKEIPFEVKYRGYVIDLVAMLGEELGFKYQFNLVKDGKYGSHLPNGEWNGLIGELLRQEADLAVIDLSVTKSRQMAVDFTMPYMNTGVGILYKKRAPAPPNLFSFLSPLAVDVWIYMSTAYLTISILMFLLARITPYEWDNPHPCHPDPDELETLFTVGNALWFGMGSLLCQGSDILPKAISTRMVAGMWWFFTLIMISSYTANLAAFLTAAKMDVPINNADDLAKQTKIKYGTYCCGSSKSFFAGSTIPTYQKLFAAMESGKPSVYTDSNREGLERVQKEDGAYAFFMEGAAIEYNVERNCDLTQIGGLLDSKGYAIALPPGSPYTTLLSKGILRLQESGALAKLKNKWWKEDEGVVNCGVSI